MMLCVKNLNINIGGFTLHDITFTVAKGDYFVLLGASGVGKTLLLESLAGVTPIIQGSIRWEDTDLSQMRIQNRGMGLVYQDQALFPHLTVRNNILYGISHADMNRAERLTFAQTIAEAVGLKDLLHRYPGTLSGGEAQRVALARALATKPRCLLLDEPLSSLDSRAQQELRVLLRKLNREGQTIIHVTHDYEEALSLANHIGVMEQGTIVQTGTPMQVFQHPRSAFVARFIGIKNVFSGTLKKTDPPQADAALFVSQGIQFYVLNEATSGSGLLLVGSEDVTLSLEKSTTSAQNCYPGKVVDIAPATIGMEVCVDIGVEITALLTGGSAERLALRPGLDVWISFKASAARFVKT